MPNKVKPPGLIGVVIYALVNGMFLLFSGILIAFAGAMIDAPEAAYIILFGLATGVLGLAFLITLYGLWLLREWGRRYMIWICILSIPLGVVAMVPWMPEQTASTGNIVFQIFGIAVAVLIIYYLGKAHIKALFAREAS